MWGRPKRKQTADYRYRTVNTEQATDGQGCRLEVKIQNSENRAGYRQQATDCRLQINIQNSEHRAGYRQQAKARDFKSRYRTVNTEQAADSRSRLQTSNQDAEQ